MKQLQITNDHGWTIDALRDYERTLKDARKRNKVAAVRLVMEGYKGIDIANLLTLHRQSVSKYVQNFNEGGIDQVIERRYAPGKTPYLTPEEEQALKQMILESTPIQEKLGMESYWDSRIIQYALEEKFNVSMTRGGICDMLHRMGLRYTRPTYTLAKADPKKQRDFLNQLDMIKKTSQTI